MTEEDKAICIILISMVPIIVKLKIDLNGII